MGLNRKQRRIRLGLPECIGFLLLVVTLAAGAASLSARQTHRWPRMSARVVGLSVPPQLPQTKRAADDAEVCFEYYVDGTRYEGEADHAALQYVIYNSLPDSIKQVLVTRGVLHLNDLAPEHLHAIADHGLFGARYLPGIEREAPDRESAPASRPLYASAFPAPLRTDTESQAWRDNETLPAVYMTVAYNPQNPHQYRVRYLGVDGYPWLVTGFFFGAMLTLGYMAFAYPRLRD
jgi:hypothetical protein